MLELFPDLDLVLELLVDLLLDLVLELLLESMLGLLEFTELPELPPLTDLLLIRLPPL